MSDQVAVMNAGRFEQVGTPQELYHAPAHRLRRRLRRRQQPLARAGRRRRTAHGARVTLGDGDDGRRPAWRRGAAAPRAPRSRSSCGPRRSRSRARRRGGGCEPAGRYDRQPAVQRRQQPRAGAAGAASSSRSTTAAPGPARRLRPARRSTLGWDARRDARAFRGGREADGAQDAGRLSLFLLLTPFLLWILLLIVLPHARHRRAVVPREARAARVHLRPRQLRRPSSASRSTGTRCSGPRSCRCW